MTDEFLKGINDIVFETISFDWNKIVKPVLKV